MYAEVFVIEKKLTKF